MEINDDKVVIREEPKKTELKKNRIKKNKKPEMCLPLVIGLNVAFMTKLQVKFFKIFLFQSEN